MMAGMMSKGKPMCASLVIVIVAMAVVFTAASAQAKFYPPGMVAYWRFDEGSGSTAYDSVNANNGSIYEASWVESGRVNSALIFDGYNDRVEIPDSDSLDAPSVSNKITLEAWLNLAEAYPGGSPQHYVIDSRDGSTGGYGFNVDSDLIQCWVGGYYPYLPATLEVGVWHHVACTYDGSEMIIYVDGVVAGSRTVTRVIMPSSSPLFIGQRYTQSERFKGMIDEVAVWSEALPQQEIQQHYQNGLNGQGYDYVPSAARLVSVEASSSQEVERTVWRWLVREILRALDLQS